MIKTDKLYYSCFRCEGLGYLPGMESQHAPNCDGFVCGEECPIAVAIHIKCKDCDGTGHTTQELLKKQLLDSGLDNLSIMELYEDHSTPPKDLFNV